MVTPITIEQAKEFISMEEDFLRSEPTFYTLTQDPLFPEWDLVTYFTSRKKTCIETVMVRVTRGYIS
jgi:hypothetical protein